MGARKAGQSNLTPPMAMLAVAKGIFAGQLLTWSLALAVIASAFALIATSHEQRQLYAQQEQLTKQRDQLDIEWRQLRLEQRVLAEHSRLESQAREKLGMQSLELQAERIVKQVDAGETQQ
jgi:cell division protein FtsL